MKRFGIRSFDAVCLFLFCLLSLQIHGEVRFMKYSKFDTPAGGENSSLALFNVEGVSPIFCGAMCLEEHCCKEIKYSNGGERCVGIQFNEFDNMGNTDLLLPGDDGMLTYQKGCMAGWLEFKGHCYHIGQSKSNWFEAKAECQSMCSYLIEVGSHDEAQWISDTFLDKVGCGADIFFDCTAWTGLNDLDTEGTYVWDHSNASLTFSSWHPQEPSLLNAAEALSKDCIDMLRGGVWNDRPCSYSNLVICEKSFGQ